MDVHADDLVVAVGREGVSDLGEGDVCDPPDLVDEGASKRAKAEAAMDRLREKFGTNAVNVGMLIGSGAKPRRDK